MMITPVSHLNEFCQTQHLPIPTFVTNQVSNSSFSAQSQFRTNVSIRGLNIEGWGLGFNKQESKHQAATDIMSKIMPNSDSVPNMEIHTAPKLSEPVHVMTQKGMDIVSFAKRLTLLEQRFSAMEKRMDKFDHQYSVQTTPVPVICEEEEESETCVFPRFKVHQPVLDTLANFPGGLTLSELHSIIVKSVKVSPEVVSQELTGCLQPYTGYVSLIDRYDGRGKLWILKKISPKVMGMMTPSGLRSRDQKQPAICDNSLHKGIMRVLTDTEDLSIDDIAEDLNVNPTNIGREMYQCLLPNNLVEHTMGGDGATMWRTL